MRTRASWQEGAGDPSMVALEERLAGAVSSGHVATPPYPAVALRVQEALHGGASLGEVARLVGADSALATNVMRCANSAMYRRGDAATTLTQAITRIGAHQVLRLTLASGLAAGADRPGPLAPLRRAYWIEGLASAAVCRDLARLRQLPAEEAFLFGLLHDFGKVVAAACLESLGDGFTGRPALPGEGFRALIERHHVAIGVELAHRWKLGERVEAMIAAHHGQGAASDDRMLATVVASDQVVALMNRAPAAMASDLARLPGLKGLDEVDAMRRLAVQVPEFVSAFEATAPEREAPSPAVARPRLRAVRPLGAPFLVKIRLARRALEYRAVALDGEAVVIEGKEPLPESRLVEATLMCAPAPFAVWTLPRGMEALADSYRVELKPYALNGLSQVLWAALAGPEA